jgi:hypothetical protein
MPRRLLFSFLILALVLAGCKSTSQAGTATVGGGITPAATAGPTAVPKQAATLSVPGQAPSVPGCTVVSFLPTPDPSSIFPPILENDWHLGSMEASVKIIEYSDFQ